MSSQQQKRKLQDSSELSMENKKPHNEDEITFSEVGADSTHIEDANESVLLNTIVDNHGSSTTDEDGDDSLVETVVSVCSVKDKSPLSKVIESLQEIIKRKEEEIVKLRSRCETMAVKVIELENKEEQRKMIEDD